MMLHTLGIEKKQGTRLGSRYFGSGESGNDDNGSQAVNHISQIDQLNNGSEGAFFNTVTDPTRE